MKLIIEIDEDDYTMCQILAKEMCDTRMKLTDNLKYAISNGTPLPKGHGRLIDADKMWDSYHDLEYDFYEAFDLADTIIEADKAESEDKE